jgi:hypothetical protein
MNYYVAIEDLKAVIDINQSKVSFICEDSPVEIEIVKQRTGYGYKLFIVCPLCGSRRIKLYSYHDSLVCRGCYPFRLYKNMTDTTKGGYEEISYRMSRVAAKYGVQINHPFSYHQMLLNKPKYMHNRTWEGLTRQLQMLANMRFQAIFMKKKYSSELIKYALGHCLYLYSLSDLDKYLIDWYGCVSVMKSK